MELDIEFAKSDLGRGSMGPACNVYVFATLSYLVTLLDVHTPLTFDEFYISIFEAFNLGSGVFRWGLTVLTRISDSCGYVKVCTAGAATRKFM
ncbi:hypothetical protein TWF718_003004 [Orbilia javanica]|uniref:Uncharacterized protein n=1 Tax=Orbilia javanica TaxID=47235 RepID=A0AAN8MLN7_9PEZI